MRNQSDIRPVVGLGPLGWGCLGVLAALLAAAFAGFDPLLHLTRFVALLWGSAGIDAFYWDIQLPAAFLIRSTGCSLLAFGYIAIALHLAPVRIRRLPLASLLIWSLAHTSWLWLYGFRLPFLLLLAPSGAPFPWHAPVIVDLALEIPTALLVLLLFRSRALAASILGVSVVSSIVTVLVVPMWPVASVLELPPWQSAATWHACSAAVLIFWSGRRRYSLWAAGPYACSICGFDRRASPLTCPECGVRSVAA
jgi:hypothetical protein